MLIEVSPSLPVQNNYHRYNVDEESFKLYGEDFKSVLKRFRRTPDYLKILQDKLAELHISTGEMGMQVLHYYRGKLEERVKEIIPAPTSTVADTPPSKDPLREKVYYPGIRRQDEPTTTEATNTEATNTEAPNIEGTTNTAAVEDSAKKIHNLDNYKVFNSLLSLAEQNNLKDVGFEFAGKIVHSIIENVAPKAESETKDEKFTHVPQGDDEKDRTTTTTHPTEHAETPKGDDAETTETTPGEEFPSTEAYRKKHAPHRRRLY